MASSLFFSTVRLFETALPHLMQAVLHGLCKTAVLAVILGFMFLPVVPIIRLSERLYSQLIVSAFHVQSRGFLTSLFISSMPMWTFFLQDKKMEWK